LSIDAQTFQFGDWHVNPSDNSISRDAQSSQMEPRAMDVLVALCREPNTIISAEQLLAQCWGSTLYGDNPVHKTIAQLRKLLGDQSSAPVYIETIRKRGYRTLALVQFDTAEDALAGTWISGSPFRGLQSFNEEHASIFFGRSDAVYYLSQQLIQQTSHAAPVELFLILGPSGSGKTSLLQAGLIPSLMTKNSALQLVSHSSFDLAERADHGLMTLLAGMLLDLEMNGQGLFPRHSAHSLGLALEDDLPTILTTLRLSLNQVAQIAPTKTYRYALFLDRFEAIFDERSISVTERECFLKLLDKLARSQSILVLLACRNDFYPQIAASPLLMEAKKRGAHFDLFAPSHAEIAQMIRRPALAANLTFGIDEQSKVRLDDVLCQVTINNPDALPLLQYTLNELYRLRTASGELSFAAFHQLGGIEGAIGRRAEQVISQLTEAQRQCLPQILSLVTTISNSDNIITSRRAAWTQLSSDDARILVTALVESRLFVSELVDGASGFGIAHEALLRRWSRVTDWIASHRHALQVRARIGEMALRWEAEARNKDLLLPEGKQLNEACDLLKLTSFSLTSLELALVSASASNMSARKRTRQIAWGGICTLVILTAGLALSALNANRQAIERPVVVERLMSTMLSEASAIGKLSLSDSARSEALAYFAKTSEQELSQVELAQRPKTLLALAELSAKRGESQAALAAWQAASAIYAKQLAVYPNDKNIITNLGEITLSIAQRHFFENNFNKAELAFRQALTYGNQLLQLEPGSLVSLNTSARAHQGLGNVAVQNGQFKVAESIFEQLTKLRTEELAFNPSDNKLKSKRNANLIDALFSLGTVKKAQGEFTAALKLHQTESAIASESYKAEPNDDLWAFRWAKSLHEQAENSLALGRDKVALKYLAQAEKLYEKIVLHEPANHGWFSALTNTKILSQDIYARLENSAANSRNILTHLHKINAELQQLGLMNPKGDLWQTQVWNQLNGQLQASIVTRLLEMKQDIAIKKSLDQAGENLISAERYLTEQLELYPFDHRAKFLLADAMIAHAAFEHYRQNDAAARQTCQRGHDLLEERVTNSLDFEILLRWIQLNICLGNTEKIASTKQSLAKIGYLDTAYLHIIAHQ
jgi:DNA-binding winged helix-turn-helix (wHTH) protein